jgi:tRNA (adenine22-N1)-methyltransferase
VDLIDGKTLDNVVVADIATDHGYLAELLSRHKKVSKVIATDISQACLDKANELKLRCKLDKIETRLGDGLNPIKKADIVVMAGIGGYEIIKILTNQNRQDNGENKCNLFVLQPSKNAAELRRFLIQKNVGILSDFIEFSSGKFYPIIVADFLGMKMAEAFR